MISVVLATLNDEAQLGRALQPLVAAAVEGLVSEVIVVDAGSTDATLEIADDAGCTILKGEGDTAHRRAAGVAAARRAWTLQLDSRAWLVPGWEAAARDHMEAHPGQGAMFGAAPAGLLGRLGLGPPAPLALLAPRGWPAAGRRPRRLGPFLVVPAPRR